MAWKAVQEWILIAFIDTEAWASLWIGSPSECKENERYDTLFPFTCNNVTTNQYWNTFFFSPFSLFSFSFHSLRARRMHRLYGALADKGYRPVIYGQNVSYFAGPISVSSQLILRRRLPRLTTADYGRFSVLLRRRDFAV